MAKFIGIKSLTFWFASSLSFSSVSFAATTIFTVNSTNDNESTSGANGVCDASVLAGTQCTLREAIKEANADTSANTVQIILASDATYQLSSGQLEITRSSAPITITSSGSTNASLVANSAARIIYISASGNLITLEKLNLQDGDVSSTSSDGGCIRVHSGTLTLESTAFNHCTASGYGGAISAIMTASYLNINRSRFTNNTITSSSGYGGAIAGNIVSITGSSFSDNTSANEGGAVYASLDRTVLTINQSSFSGNTANYGSALIVYNSNYDLSINASSFIANTATNEATIFVDNAANTTITHTTIAENTGGRSLGLEVVNATTLALSHNLIANNLYSRDGTESEDLNTSISVTSLGHNLFESITDSAIAASLAATDLYNVDFASATILTTASDNTTCPSCRYVQYAPTSAAVNPTGSTTCLDSSGSVMTTDMIGNAIDDGQCDIGAIEYHAACGNGYIDALNSETCDDGNTDSNDICSSTCQSQMQYYRDADHDGFGTESDTQFVLITNPIPSGYTVIPGDCDDNNSAILPGAMDTCGDGIDQDCSGTDEICASASGGDDSGASSTDDNSTNPETESGTDSGSIASSDGGGNASPDNGAATNSTSSPASGGGCSLTTQHITTTTPVTNLIVFIVTFMAILRSRHAKQSQQNRLKNA